MEKSTVSHAQEKIEDQIVSVITVEISLDLYGNKTDGINHSLCSKRSAVREQLLTSAKIHKSFQLKKNNKILEIHLRLKYISSSIYLTEETSENEIRETNPQKENYNALSFTIRRMVKNWSHLEGNYDPVSDLNPFLHNIYYQYISRRNKKTLTSPNLGNFAFSADFNDVNITLPGLNVLHNVIFGGAFDHVKLPKLLKFGSKKKLNLADTEKERQNYV